MKSLYPAGLLPLVLLVSARGEALFQDTFQRPDSRNIQQMLDGVTNNTGTPLAAGGVYTQPHLDPNNRAPIFDIQDADGPNAGGARIIGDALQFAVGVGTSNAYINHNFTNPSITAAGGFSVALDLIGYAGTTNGQGGGFAIGMSQSEAEATRDAFNGAARMTGAFEAGIGTAVAPQVVSDFWIVLRGNNTLVWGSRTGTVMGATALPSKVGRVAVNFRFPDFNEGTGVEYQVLHEGIQRGTGTFAWSETGQNFIGVDARDASGVSFEELRIGTDFADPLQFPPFVAAFEATRLDGTTARVHWDIIEGTAGDPVNVTITSGGGTVHTSNALRGFANVPFGDGNFGIMATNQTDTYAWQAQVPPENALSTAIRAAGPVAWYRFEETLGATLVADSANNAAPHNGTILGNAAPGYPTPTGTGMVFGGNGSVLLDAIFDPATPIPGYTIEAVVLRQQGSPLNAAIVSQIDGAGVGRSHFSVDFDGTIQSFLAGGPAARKDADGRLPSNTWAHLAMVVDRATPEIRWYLDGVQIGSTLDGTNPDGSTFNPNFTIESATGAWRLGTQKLANQNFWLGSMDEVAIYNYLLDDPNGDRGRDDSRVQLHADAWRTSASGLLGFFADAETIEEGASTTLRIKVGDDVTSVSIDGIGTVIPADGWASLQVSPTETTIFTVVVEGSAGLEFLSATVVVVPVSEPAGPPMVTGTSIAGGEFRISFVGTPATEYRVRGSLNLNGFGLDLGTSTTDAAGHGTVAVPLVGGRSQQFYRIEEIATP